MASGSYSLVSVCRILTAVTSLVAEPSFLDMQASVVTAHGPVVAAPGRAQSQKLCHMRLVAPRHEGSSWVRGQTPVSCIGRQILYH